MTKNTIESLVQDLKPVRVLKGSWLIGLYFVGAILSAIAIMAVLGPRSDMFEPDMMVMFSWKTGTFLLFAYIFARALVVNAIPGRSHDTIGRILLFIAICILVTPALYELWHVPSDQLFEILTHWSCLLCLVASGLASLPGFALALIWIRKAKPLHPEKCLLLAGTAAGAIGVFGYGFHCMLDNPVFVMLWYTLAMLVPAAIVRLMIPLILKGRNRLTWLFSPE